LTDALAKFEKCKFDIPKPLLEKYDLELRGTITNLIRNLKRQNKAHLMANFP